MPVGLKLLSEAQANKKSAYYNLKAVFMRCDFYPLAAKKVKVKELNFNLFLNPHSPEIKDWLISIDKFLCDNGTESMLDTMSDGKHECSGCASKNPDWCAHGGGFKFTHKGKKYNRCQHNGFGFPLDKAEEREIIEKWIMMELAWS